MKGIISHFKYLLRTIALLIRSCDSVSFLIIVTSSVFAAAIPVVYLLVIQRIIDASVENVGAATLEGHLILWLGLFLFIGFIAKFSSLMNQYRMLGLNEKIKIDAYTQLISRASECELSQFESPRYYDKLQRAIVGLDHHLIWVIMSLPLLPIEILSAVGLLAYVGTASIFFPIALILGVIPLMIADAKWGRKRWDLDVGQMDEERESLYLESLITSKESASEIRLFGLGDHLIENWVTKKKGMYKAKTELARNACWRGIIGQIYIPLTILLIMGGTVVWVSTGVLTLGHLASYLIAVEKFSSALWRLNSTAVRIRNSMLYLNDYFEFLDDSEIVNKVSSVADKKVAGESGIANSGPPKVEVRDLSYRYPGATVNAIENISFDIVPGENVALVGRNGSGKSTLVKLLLGLYRPNSGTILVDGDRLHRREQLWMQECSAVFQDHYRYHLTVCENVGFGRIEEIENEEMIQVALEQCGASLFINQLPYGLQTILGKTVDMMGTDLSVGQWQKIALSRCIFRGGQFSTLDEPTAALDPYGEIETYRTYGRFAKEQTVLFVSHRLGAAKLADRILVIHNGEIVEMGSHEDLLREKGIYYNMYHSQQQLYI